jgi:Uma2 family endonuclease
MDMATATTRTTDVEGPSDAAPARGGFRPYQMTVDVYERIAESGAFGPRSKVILLNGQLVEKVSDMTKGRPHVIASVRLDGLLDRLVSGQDYYVEQEQPIALPGHRSEPEPDVKCVRGSLEDYMERAPTAADCPLVAEVADESLRDDEGEMYRLYAAASIPVYWIVNIPRDRIDVYTGPSGPAETPTYAERRHYGRGEAVPVVLDGREVGRINVADVLP